MSKKLDLVTLQIALSGTAAAFRSRSLLQPAAGDGTKVFPPTYAGAVYATENRRVKKIDGQIETIPCVLLDSVQAQANRMEDALQTAIDAGRFAKSPIPLIQVDFAGGELGTSIGKITSLQAPHRVADAILRDSLLEGQPFRKSAIGAKLNHVSLQNATALYEICPTALVFGMWDSTGPKGGAGAKFQRVFVSEIVGINTITGVKTSSRIDPLSIQRQAGPVYRTAEQSPTMDPAQALKIGDKPVLFGKRKGKDVAHDIKAPSFPDEGRPSAANHGNIPPDVSENGGVTLDYAEQTAVLSLPALRRLHFPLADGTRSVGIDTAGQTVLAALALAAAALAGESGFDLRSRCLLWPAGPLTWELLNLPGAVPTQFTISSNTALEILADAVTAAEALGLRWRREPLVLQPSPALLELLRRSQQLAALGTPETEE